MSAYIEMRVPCGTYGSFEFITVKAKPITIKGFEEFSFVIHRPVRYSIDHTPRFVEAKSGWVVAGYPNGFCVNIGRIPNTQEETITATRNYLLKCGKEKTAEAFARAADILAKGRP